MDKNYPKHIYDPLRIKIAAEQLQHEFRKLFPSAKESDWPKLDADIANWFNGERSELAPVFDFWNSFEGIMRGFKLKGLCQWITASNINWTEKVIPTKEILLTWANPQLAFMGKPPYRAIDVADALAKNQAEYQKVRADSNARVRAFVPRDHHKVIILNAPGGGSFYNFSGYQVLEGNRRILRAILYNQEKITAYVGEFNDEQQSWPKNYWVSTSMMRNLIFLADDFLDQNNQTGFQGIANTLEEILKISEIARINTKRAFQNSPASNKLKKILKDYIKE